MSFQDEVGKWAKETFPGATDREIMIHLNREVRELDTDIAGIIGPNDRFMIDCMGIECADIYMILLHLCHRHGVDLQEAARKKFEINKTRKWGPPDAEGVREHIRKPETTLGDRLYDTAVREIMEGKTCDHCKGTGRVHGFGRVGKTQITVRSEGSCLDCRGTGKKREENRADP